MESTHPALCCSSGLIMVSAILNPSVGYSSGCKGSGRRRWYKREERRCLEKVEDVEENVEFRRGMINSSERAAATAQRGRSGGWNGVIPTSLLAPLPATQSPPQCSDSRYRCTARFARTPELQGVWGLNNNNDS